MHVRWWYMHVLWKVILFIEVTVSLLAWGHKLHYLLKQPVLHHCSGFFSKPFLFTRVITENCHIGSSFITISSKPMNIMDLSVFIFEKFDM